MTVEKVEWQYLDGTRAFRHLINMVSKALEVAQISVYRASAAWDSMGFYIDNKHFWVGIEYSWPEVLQFYFDEASVDMDKFKELGRGRLFDGKPLFELDLTAEATHFFSRTADSQLALIKEFLESASRDARSCVAVRND